MMTFLYGTNIPKLSSLLKNEIFNKFFLRNDEKFLIYQSKNFLPPREPSQSPRAFGSWRPTNMSSESIEATGPQYRMRPTTTRPVFAITFASWPGFKHFGDFGKNGSDCFDGWKSSGATQANKSMILIANPSSITHPFECLLQSIVGCFVLSSLQADLHCNAEQIHQPPRGDFQSTHSIHAFDIKPHGRQHSVWDMYSHDVGLAVSHESFASVLNLRSFYKKNVLDVK